MAKKKLDLGKILCCASALFGLIAVFMVFAPNIILAEHTETQYSGLITVFGAEYKTEVLGNEVSSKIFDFSFLNLLPYILAIVGVVFAGLAAFGKLGKIAPIVSAACFVVAAILFFIAIPGSVMHNSEKLNADQIAKVKETFALGAGAIVAGVFSIISALAVAGTIFVNKK